MIVAVTFPVTLYVVPDTSVAPDTDRLYPEYFVPLVIVTVNVICDPTVGDELLTVQDIPSL